MDEIQRILANWGREAAEHDNIHSVRSEVLDQCASEIAQAVASLQAGWRPIETAPTDGTLFLAWGPEKNHEDAAVVRAELVPHRNGPYIQCTRPGAWDDGCLYLTHWMPLPEQPRE